MSEPLDPIPEDADLVNTNRKLSRRYFIWLYGLWLRVRANVAVVGSPLASPNLIATLAATTLYTTVQAGFLRVSYYLRVTTLPTTSFSLTVTIGWREGGVTKSQTFAALVGAPGTLATAYQADQIPIVADSGTVITVSVAYVSVGATAAIYNLTAAVELIN